MASMVTKEMRSLAVPRTPTWKSMVAVTPFRRAVPLYSVTAATRASSEMRAAFSVWMYARSAVPTPSEADCMASSRMRARMLAELLRPASAAWMRDWPSLALRTAWL